MRIRAALLGILSAACGVAAGELVAALIRPASGPLVAVGGAVIDATPTPVKEFAVRELGTADKPVLLGSIALVLTLFAAAVGILAVRRRAFAVAGPAVLGLAAAVAAFSRPAATVVDTVPSLVAGVIAAGALTLTVARLPSAEAAPAAGVHLDRRKFLQAAALIAGGTVLAGGGAGLVKRARGGATTAARAAIRLPMAADPAGPLPAGLAPGFVTDGLYRVDTALTVPRIDLGSWKLRVHGRVRDELTLTFAELLERPLIERHITLNCVSNEVGGPYVGTGKWLGVPLAPLLREAGLDPAADQLVARSVDGMTIGTPVATVLDGRDAMLCVGLNGEPLPAENGFPVRMLTPGLYGYAGACKWVTELELTTFADFDAYWVRRGWAARGPVRTASRIDRPQPFAEVAAGPVTVAGVAWAQGRGIRAVEVRVDEGPWQPAELLSVPSVDTWVQWRLTWAATPGRHALTVRATDGAGEVQTADRRTPFPSGATGWHNVTVSILP